MKTPPIRALLVDDDTLVADLVEEQLARVGVEVVGRASDGARAIAQTETLRPDVVLMDIQLPEMDGIEAARRIQDRCPTPIVALTVWDSSEIVKEASAAGMGAYVVKPGRSEELFRAITIARARFEDLRELRRLNAELRKALADIKTLSGFLPICAWCKQIRDDKGEWHPLESYVRDHTDAQLTHTYCPACTEKMYPDKDPGVPSR